MEAIADHEARALARLPDDSRNEIEEALVRWWALRIQDLDTVAMELFTNRTIDTAVGAQLDGLGAIVGEQRGARDDDSYRLRIRVRILLNLSSGRADELLRVLRMVTDLVLTLTDEAPGAISIAVSGGVPPLPDDLFAVALEAKAAGVRLFLTHQAVPDAERFVFKGGVGLGFGAQIEGGLSAAVPGESNGGSEAPTLFLNGQPVPGDYYTVTISGVTPIIIGGPSWQIGFSYRLAPSETPRVAYIVFPEEADPDDYSVALLLADGVTNSGLSISMEPEEPYTELDTWTWTLATAHEAEGGQLLNAIAG